MPAIARGNDCVSAELGARAGFVNGQNGNPPPATYTITQTGQEYRVRACNMDGRELRCSGWSPVASGATAGATVGGVSVQ